MKKISVGEPIQESVYCSCAITSMLKLCEKNKVEHDVTFGSQS